MKAKSWRMDELSAFCMEYFLLLKAGMPPEECFSVLAENESDPSKKELFLHLYEKKAEGDSLYETMREAGVFPEYLLRMVMLGEETGNLESTFHSLGGYYEERYRMLRSLKEAAAFPIVLLVVMAVVAVILLTKVMPVFQSVFAQLGSTLPPFSMALLHFGQMLERGRYVFLTVLAATAGAALFAAASPKRRQKLGAAWNRFFYQTKLGRLYGYSRFASALSMAVSSGQSLDRALELAEEFCTDSGLTEKIRACRKAHEEGEAFEDAVKKQELLSPMYCRMLSVGIRTGDLDTALSEIAGRSAREAAGGVTKAASMIEPAVVILLSVMTGVLLLSVMLPLVGVLSSFG